MQSKHATNYTSYARFANYEFLFIGDKMTDFYVRARAVVNDLLTTAEKYPCDATKAVAIYTIKAYQRIGLYGDGYATTLIEQIERY